MSNAKNLNEAADSGLLQPRLVREEYGVNATLAEDVKLGNRDAMWTLPAGSTGVTRDTPYGFGVKLDGQNERVVWVGPKHWFRSLPNGLEK